MRYPSNEDFYLKKRDFGVIDFAAKSSTRRI
jgi:hypothetical protein